SPCRSEMRASPRTGDSGSLMVTIEDVRALTLTLPRTTEALVRDRVKFRVGRLVYLAFSRDETIMGFRVPEGRARSARGLGPGEVPDARTGRQAVPLGAGQTRCDRREGDAGARAWR